jgi:hypothetical protein
VTDRGLADSDVFGSTGDAALAQQSVEALDRVEVCPRVRGYLESAHFDDGQIVGKDELPLTLSPILLAILIKRDDQHAKPWALTYPNRKFFAGFSLLFNRLAAGYGNVTRRLVRMSVLMLVVYGGLIGLAAHQFQRTPGGRIPEQGQGYFIAMVQMPRPVAVTHRRGGLSAEPGAARGGRCRPYDRLRRRHLGEARAEVGKSTIRVAVAGQGQLRHPIKDLPNHESERGTADLQLPVRGRDHYV